MEIKQIRKIIREAIIFLLIISAIAYAAHIDAKQDREELYYCTSYIENLGSVYVNDYIIYKEKEKNKEKNS